MSTLVFPPSLTPAKTEWGLQRNVSNNQSPYGQVQRSARGSDPWYAAVHMPTKDFTQEDARIFSAFIAQATRGDRHFYLHNHAHSQRGSFSDAELLTNPTFDGTTGWTASGSTIREGSRLLRVENSGAAEGYAYQSVSLTAGDAVCFIADMLAGSASSAEIEIYDDTGLAIIASANGSGRLVCSAVVANTGTHQFRLKVNTAVSGDYLYFAQATASVCGLVNGASQTGASLTLDTLAASTNGLLKAGDKFCVYVDSVPHMVELTRDLDTNASGQARAFFEPALPGSPADNAPVIIRKPFARMYVPSHSYTAMHAPPSLTGYAFDCLEDTTR